MCYHDNKLIKTIILYFVQTVAL